MPWCKPMTTFCWLVQMVCSTSCQRYVHTQYHSVICYWNIRKYIFVNWFCSEIWTPHLFPNQSRRVPYKQVEMIDGGKSSTNLINLTQCYFCCESNTNSMFVCLFTNISRIFDEFVQKIVYHVVAMSAITEKNKQCSDKKNCFHYYFKP